MYASQMPLKALLSGLTLYASIVAQAAGPKMLFQGKAVRDSGATGGARTSYSIMRLPDGNFAFYDRNNPRAGPLTLPDREGTLHTLLPYLPPDIVKSQTIAESQVLANTQVILTADHQVKSIFVKGQSLDKETAAQVGLPRYLDVWIKQASLTAFLPPKMIWRGYNGSQMEYQQLPGGRIIVPDDASITNSTLSGLVQTSHSKTKVNVSKIYGKIKFVNSFPDYKVQIVDSFPDLKVQLVNSFPDKPGKWKLVDSFPEYKIQIVNSFPDFKIKYVNSFPGVP